MWRRRVRRGREAMHPCGGLRGGRQGQHDRRACAAHRRPAPAERQDIAQRGSRRPAGRTAAAAIGRVRRLRRVARASARTIRCGCGAFRPSRCTARRQRQAQCWQAARLRPATSSPMVAAASARPSPRHTTIVPPGARRAAARRPARRDLRGPARRDDTQVSHRPLPVARARAGVSMQALARSTSVRGPGCAATRHRLRVPAATTHSRCAVPRDFAAARPQLEIRPARVPGTRLGGGPNPETAGATRNRGAPRARHPRPSPAPGSSPAPPRDGSPCSDPVG